MNITEILSGVKASVFIVILERKHLSSKVIIPVKTQTDYIKEDKHVEEQGQGTCLTEY